MSEMMLALDMQGNAIGNEGIKVDRCIASLDLDSDSSCNVHACEVGCGMLITCG